ncbi:MAG: DHA2 family efflux MFS transporter permease subunit, partial [Solirubrobacteraceae bacterium]
MNSSSEDRIDAYVWRISAVVVLGSIMSILDTTIVNVALDTLSRDLHTSIDGIQWVANGYLLSLAAIIPVTGWAARRFGAKPIYLVSLVLFTAGSALCGLATSAPELILFRVLQGIGGGMILPVGQLMMAEAAGPKRMGRVMSVVAVPAMLAPIFGPMIGGLILEHLAWRWIFYVNLPIGIIAVIAAARTLPSVARQPTERLDFRGLAMLATGLPLITYGLAEIGTTNSFTAFKVIGPIVAGAVLVTAFAFYSLRTRLPLLNLRLYSRSTFSTGSIAMFCVGAALFGGMILLPLYWQTVRGDSVFVTGLLTAPQGVGAALIMPLSGKLTDRLGGGPLTLFGVLLTAAATVPFALIGAHTSVVWLCCVMVVRGFGIGFAFIPAMAAA